MTSTVTAPGNSYHFIPGVFQYSAGVAARPGFRLERFRFTRPIPLTPGFARIAAHLAAIGRPRQALCACEIHSPAPFTEPEFTAFNTAYVDVLDEWDIIREGINPIARSNTCPVLNPPPEPAFHAFTITLPDPNAPPSFVIAGSGECPEGQGNYRDHIIAPGDTSPSGLQAKATWVRGEMERRLAAVGAGWADVTAAQLYSAHDIGAAAIATLFPSIPTGLTWHLNRPPVEGLEFEMDCRCVPTETVLPA